MKQKPTKAELDFNFRLKKVLIKYPYLKKENQKVFKHHYGWYILDVYIGSLRLGFEIDGGYHWNSKQLDRDLKRDSFFDSQDIKLIHFPNSKLNSSGKRKHIEYEIELIIEKRIGELRSIRPLQYIKLKQRLEKA